MRMMASSSAITTRSDKWGPFRCPWCGWPAPSFNQTGVTASAWGSAVGAELVEQLVLLALELGDRVDHVLAVARHGVGVLARVVRLVRRTRGLRDQSADRGVVGVVPEHGELLVDLGELGAQRLEPRRVLREPS